MKAQADLQSVVFVVDDYASMREAMQFLFQSVGLRTEVFASTDEFLRISSGGRTLLPGARCQAARSERP